MGSETFGADMATASGPATSVATANAAASVATALAAASESTALAATSEPTTTASSGPVATALAAASVADPMQLLEDGADVRARKSALMEVIELQQRLIQRRDLDSTTTGDDTEEMAWYTEQTKRLERFKLALNALRLQPDEFELSVPSEWMPGCRAGARGMADCKLRINARSQMALVPGDAAARPSGDAATASVDGSGEPSEDAEARRPRVFFIDELRVIRCEAEPPTTTTPPTPPTTPTLVLGWRRVEDGTEFSLRCLSPEAAELSEVLGQHLQRYNQSRVATAARLAALHALKCTPYRSDNEAHEQLLRRLWQCGFPGVPLAQRVTSEWVRLGFQGDDPATDFRGMGVLGLHNLVYFGEHYPG